MRNARMLSTVVLLGFVTLAVTACGTTGDSKEIGDAITSFFKWIGDPREHGMFSTETLQSLLPGYLTFYLLFVLFGALKAGSELLGARRRQARLDEMVPIFFKWILLMVLTLGFILLNANLTEIGRPLWTAVGLDNVESIRRSLGLVLPNETGFDLVAVLKEMATGALSANFLSVGTAISFIAGAFTVSTLYEALIGLVYVVVWMPVVFTTGKLRFLLIPLSTVFMWFVFGMLLGSAFAQNPNNPTMVMLWMIVAPVLAVAVPAFVMALVIWSTFWSFGPGEQRTSRAEEDVQTVGGVAALALLLKQWADGGDKSAGGSSRGGNGSKPPPPPAPGSRGKTSFSPQPVTITDEERDSALPGEWYSTDMTTGKRTRRSSRGDRNARRDSGTPAPPAPVTDPSAVVDSQARADGGNGHGQSSGARRTARPPVPPPPPSSPDDVALEVQVERVVSTIHSDPAPPAPDSESWLAGEATPPSPAPPNEKFGVWRAMSEITDEQGRPVAHLGEVLLNLEGSSGNWTKGGHKLVGEIEEV